MIHLHGVFESQKQDLALRLQAVDAIRRWNFPLNTHCEVEKIPLCVITVIREQLLTVIKCLTGEQVSASAVKCLRG